MILFLVFVLLILIYLTLGLMVYNQTITQFKDNEFFWSGRTFLICMICPIAVAVANLVVRPE